MTPEQLRISVIRDVLTGKLTLSRNSEELKAIDDEYFEMYQVPAAWDIVELAECCYIHARIGWQALRKDEHQKEGEYLLVTGTDFKNGCVDYSSCVFVSKERYEMDEKIQIQNDDILVTKDGSIGKVAVVKDLPLPATLNAGVFVIRPDDRFYNRYIEYLFQCSYFSHFVNMVKSGTTIKHLNQNKLLKFKIPVPCIEEQIQIVEVLDKLLPYVDTFGGLNDKLEKINTKFPEDMKKSILKYAIMGKLVEQREEEGTAEDLYQQIQEEKQKLIKEGKIKKEKPLGDITEDEIPFEVPKSWKWVRIGSIFTLQAGKSISSSDIHDTKSEISQYLCYGGNGIRGYVSEPNRNGYYAIIGRQGALCGCINFAKGEFYATEHAVVVDHYGKTDTLWGGLFLKALNLNQYATATAQPGLAVANINQVLIPLPPLEEQKRIVAKIEELMPYCERLM